MPIATEYAHVGYGVSAAALLEEHQVPAPQVGPRPDLVPVLELQEAGNGGGPGLEGLGCLTRAVFFVAQQGAGGERR